MKCELVRTTAPDGVRLDGAWFEPLVTADATSAAPDVVVGLHGVASSFYSSNLFENLAPGFLQRGVPLLLVNTRGHDTVHYSYGGNSRRLLGAAYEIVDECRLDMAAWSEWLTRRGRHRILFAGHSLGAIKILYGTAVERRPETSGLIAMSAPRLAGNVFRNGSESGRYLESLAMAQNLIRDGRPDALLESTFPFPMLITAAGYIDKYGPDERYNFLQHLPRLSCPTLLTYGGLELQSGASAFAGLAEAIAEVLPNAPHLTLTVIPQADHNYSGQASPLADAIDSWWRTVWGS